MKSNNFETVQRSTLEELVGHRPDRLQLVEAYLSFANLGPYDFRTGAELIYTACSEALARLLPIALRDTGQSGVVAKFLLGLYNGPRFPFDLTELRRLDHKIFLDCVTVLMRDSIGGKEVHLYFENGDKIWEQLAAYWSPIQKQ